MKMHLKKIKINMKTFLEKLMMKKRMKKINIFLIIIKIYSFLKAITLKNNQFNYSNNQKILYQMISN